MTRKRGNTYRQLDHMISEIKLADNIWCKVDTEFLPQLLRNTWYPVWKDTGYYAQAMEQGRHVYMHRLIANTPGKLHTDHINRDTLDNRRENLRICDNAQNIANSKISIHNTSSYTGVTFDSNRNKWIAQTYVKNRKIFIGRFDTKEDAASAYNKAKAKRFGDFARLNIVKSLILVLLLSATRVEGHLCNSSLSDYAIGDFGLRGMTRDQCFVDTTYNNSINVINACLATITDCESGVVDKGGQLFNVAAFGAKADDGADDYAALHSVAARVNAECAAGRGATVFFPPGTYTIDQYRIVSGPSANGITNITWGPNCHGLVLSGYGAKIDVKGGFYQPNDGTLNRSTVQAVVPFVITQSSDVVVEGFEIDGNVDQTTRDPAIGESPADGGIASHLIVTRELRRYVLRDLYLHHAQVDAVLIGFSATTVDRDGVLERVTAWNNARQGVSIIAARGITIRDSDLSYTGVTGGTYGFYDPAAGLDIEPDHCAIGDPTDVCGGGTATQDERTGDIRVERTRFWGSVGSQIVAFIPRIENVTFDQVDIRDDTNSVVAWVARIACKGCTLQNSYINASDETGAALFPIWSENTVNTDVRVLNNVFEGSKRGLRIATYPGRVLIAGNTFRYTGTVAVPDWFPAIQAATDADVSFINNTIEMPVTAHDGVTSDEVVKLTGVRDAHGNVYKIGYTGSDASFDVDACTASTVPYPCCTGSGTGTCNASLLYTVDYSGSADVRDEHFLSGNLFRPSTSWVSRSQPYATGTQSHGLLTGTAQFLTIADNANGATAATATLTVTATYIRITCNDAQGCDVTMGETPAPPDGALISIVNTSANTVNFADTSGVSELASTFAAAQYDTITMRYASDRWVETGRSDN